MRKLNSILIALFLTTSVFAQSPERMSYQAVIRNSSNQLVTSHVVGMKISILQGSITGTPVYVETQTPTTNANGLATVEIGGGTVVSGVFSTINWSSGLYFIKTETDPTGSTSYSITGTSQLLSVPYALYAKTADYNNLTNKPTGNNAGDIQYWNGTSWVILPAGTSGQTLTVNASNIPVWKNASVAPTASTQAVSNVLMNSVTINGNVNANGFSATVDFEYGTTTSYGSIVEAIQSPVIGSTATNVSASIVTLANTTYHFRIKTANSVGVTYGNDMSFTTSGQAPTATTLDAIKSSLAATLNGSVNANGYSTTISFEFGTSTSYGTTITPTQSTVAGNSSTNVYAIVTGLTANTTYHFRVKANNTIGTTYGSDMTILTPATAADYDGNTYNTIIIGTQTWMQENLKTTHYRDGSPITNVTDNATWTGLTTEAYCWYNNDIGNKNIYGALYNYYAVSDSRRLCPAGWHVPSDSEWNTLATYLGGEDIAGAKLKEVGTLHWVSTNTETTNESGFTALPSGCRQSGYFTALTTYIDLWSYTSFDATVWYRYINTGSNSFTKSTCGKSLGFSVRCVKD